jgi:hypothetical protein
LDIVGRLLDAFAATGWVGAGGQFGGDRLKLSDFFDPAEGSRPSSLRGNGVFETPAFKTCPIAANPEKRG